MLMHEHNCFQLILAKKVKEISEICNEIEERRTDITALSVRRMCVYMVGVCIIVRMHEYMHMHR